MKKQIQKIVRKLKVTLLHHVQTYKHYINENYIILPFQQKKNEVISLSRLNVMIKYKHLCDVK